MIDSIKITNYQCHEDLELVLSPNINTITGESDKGKSAIIRALKWAAFNRPSGDAFRTHGTKETSVTIKTGGKEVGRRKQKSLNEYSLDGKKYTGFGSNVPEDISDALRLEVINFQGQHDSPFMLSQTAGEVGRQLNETVNLDIIDLTLSNLNKKRRDNLNAIKHTEIQVKEVKEQLEPFDIVEEMAEKLEKARLVESECKTLQSQKESLCGLVNDAKEAQERLDKMPDVTAAYESLVLIEAESAKCGKLSAEADTLMTLADQVNKTWKSIPDLGNIEADLEALEKQSKKCGNVVEKMETLEDLTTDIQVAKKKVKTHAKQVDEKEQAKKAFEKEMGDICPLCDQKIP